MNTNFRTARLAAAALVGLVAATSALQPTMAEEMNKPKQQVIDARTTGSIATADKACDPREAKAGLLCRITGGEATTRYPSAPVNPAFGF